MLGIGPRYPENSFGGRKDTAWNFEGLSEVLSEGKACALYNSLSVTLGSHVPPSVSFGIFSVTESWVSQVWVSGPF